MEYFRYTLQFLNTITFTSSTYAELDNFLNGVVKGYLNHNFGFLPIAPTEDELDELALEIGASYDLMLNDIKPRYEEVLRLGTVHTFRSKDTTKSEYGAENRTGKYYEPVVSSAQAEVKTNGENTTWGDDKTTLDREEDKVLSESAIKDFFKEIKEEVELYFIDFVNIYADGTGCQKPYTLEQLEAINSGITKSKVEQIQTNKENIDLLVDAVSGITDALDDKQDKLSATQLDAVNSGIDATKVAQIETNKNNIAQLSNPNLLINGDFRVNQRGKTSYTGNNTYTADRWQQGSGSFDYSTKTWTPATQYSGFIQKIEDFEKFRGKTVTLSLYINSCSTSGVFDLLINDGSNHRTLEPVTSGFNGIRTYTYTIPQTATQLRFGLIYLGTATTDNISIKWVKAEIGSITTPFSPRPIAEELALCQRYYQKFGNGTILYGRTGFSADTTCVLFTPLPVTMRTKYTTSITGTLFVYGNGLTKTPTNLLFDNQSLNGFRFVADIPTGIGVKEVVVLEGATVELDAEIY